MALQIIVCQFLNAVCQLDEGQILNDGSRSDEDQLIIVVSPSDEATIGRVGSSSNDGVKQLQVYNLKLFSVCSFVTFFRVFQFIVFTKQ